MGVEAGSHIPADLLELFKAVEAEQHTVAQRDLAFLQSQFKQMWKNHKKIISVVTRKSKNQLRRMTNLHTASAVAFTTQLRDMLGGNYGEFMQNLVLPAADIDTEVMKNALGCIGCDENAIVNVFGIISPSEMEALKRKYNEAGVIDLASKVHGKLEKESAMQKLMQAILSNAREEDVFSTDADPHQQLETMHAVCNEKTPSRDRDLFNMVSKLSREQCEILNDECVKKYGMKLDKMFSLKYSGNCLRVLKLWTLPRDSAIAQLLHDILHSTAEEYGGLAFVIPKYDKIHLRGIAEMYHAMFNENLMSRIDSVLTGNFKVAVVGWIHDAAFDGSHEEEVMMIGARHGSIANALHDEKALHNIRELMRKQLDVLTAFNAAEGSASGDDAKSGGSSISKNTLPPINRPAPVHQAEKKEEVTEMRVQIAEVSGYAEPPSQLSKKSSMDLHSLEILDDKAIEPMPSPARGDHTPLYGADSSTPGKESKLQRLASTRAINKSQSAFDSKYAAVCNFLSDMFVVFDKDKSGFLESAEFWNILRSLDLGYSDEEIAGMAQWTDWDCDGSISYEEVVNELADSLIAIIEGRGGDVLSDLAKISARIHKEQADIDNMENKGGLSPTLVQYLKDSFEAYDVDDNGGLGPDEFWKVLNVILVEIINGLKDVEIEELRVSLRMRTQFYHYIYVLCHHMHFCRGNGTRTMTAGLPGRRLSRSLSRS